MSLLLVLGLSLALGSALGWVYFQALWTVVQRLPWQRRPGLWMPLSLLTRLALMLAGFMLVVRWGGWPGLSAALAGFLIARTVLVRRARVVPPVTAAKP